jgi:signal recognition particle receptor subunit beta
MASVNALSRELVFKIVYYGPGLSGKTTTLQHIHATVRPEHRGKMVSLATPVDRTLYFDFLPIRLPRVRGMGVRLQLFTVPGQVYYNATRKLVLTGADGLVFVSDSQSGRTDSSLEAMENLRENLQEHGRTLVDFPHVIQHNKRDLSDILSLEELDRMLNAHKAPSFGTVATRGDGVYEALETITKLIVAAFESSIPPGERQIAAELEAIEGGLSEALRNADASAPSAEPPSVIESLTVPPSGAESTPSSAPPGGDRPDRGAEAPGEVAARALLRNEPLVSFTVADLWPDGERDAVREVEAAIMGRRYARAIEMCDALVARVLAGAAGVFGSAEAPRDAATVPLLLGLDGRSISHFACSVARPARAARSRRRTRSKRSSSPPKLAYCGRRCRAMIP